MAALELACAAGAYIHADRQPVVGNVTFGASLAILDGLSLDITCNLRTGAFSVQNALSCTLLHLSEVSIQQSFPYPFPSSANVLKEPMEWLNCVTLSKNTCKHVVQQDLKQVYIANDRHKVD